MSDSLAKPNDELAQVYQPKSLEQAQWLAKQVVSSGLAPSDLRKPQDALVILMTGAELGLRPMEALRGIYVVNGRPTLKADLMVALVRKSPECEYFTRTEMNNERCTYETKRSDQPQPQEYTYTIEQAHNAGLTDKDVWEKYPDRMLRARAASALAREEYPEVLLGLYTPEEASSIDDDPETDPVVAEVVEDDAAQPEPTGETAEPEPSDDAVADASSAVAANDARCEQLTDRIRDLVEEAALDFGRVCEPLAAWACDEYDVDHWRWLDWEQLTEIGKDIASHSAKGGRLSPRRLAIVEHLEPYLDRRLDVEDAVEWSATSGESDDWDTANGRWRVLVDEVADGRETRRQLHEALKARHDVESFNDLTVAQIVESVGELESRGTEPEDDHGAVAPRLEYILAEIDRHLPDDQEELDVDGGGSEAAEDGPAGPFERPPTHLGENPNRGKGHKDSYGERGTSATYWDLDALAESDHPAGRLVTLLREGDVGGGDIQSVLRSVRRGADAESAHLAELGADTFSPWLDSLELTPPHVRDEWMQEAKFGSPPDPVVPDEGDDSGSADDVDLDALEAHGGMVEKLVGLCRETSLEPAEIVGFVDLLVDQADGTETAEDLPLTFMSPVLTHAEECPAVQRGEWVRKCLSIGQLQEV